MFAIQTSQGSASIFDEAATSVPQSPSLAAPVRSSVAFANFPNDVFHYTVSTDKLETVLAFESKLSKDQWECRVDDESLKKCGPDGVEIPRSVVATLLTETLAKQQQVSASGNATGAAVQAAGHTVTLSKAANETDLQLVLALDFGAGFCPTYRLTLAVKAIKTEDRLRAQIVDLQDEMVAMRAQMQSLQVEMSAMRKQTKYLEKELDKQSSTRSSKYHY